MAFNPQQAIPLLFPLARALIPLGIGSAAVSSTFYTVDGGQKAIIFDRFGGVLEDTIGEGTHFKIPFLQKPYIFDIRTRPHEFSSMSGDRARDFNIILDDVAITHLSYGNEFAKAVEQKQVAQQEAERSRYLVMKSEQEKRAAVIREISEATAASGMGLIELRKIEAMKENVATMAKSPNVTYVSGAMSMPSAAR